jgi:hypothetical protein
MKKTTMIALVALVSFGAYAQHDHAEHGNQKAEQAKFKDDKLGTAYTHYIHLKDALVASDAAEAKKAAGELQKALASVAGAKKAADEALKVSSASGLEDQRKAFAGLSNEVTTLVKNGKLVSGSLYVEYCPMANNNEGAFWLSNEKQIKNPYFGNAMLKCGSVKETIQ